jgi:hypothetical protein
MRTRPRICHRKSRYESDTDALAAAEKAPFPLRPYRCELCREWHLTSRTKGMKLPRFEIERRKASRMPGPPPVRVSTSLDTNGIEG